MQSDEELIEVILDGSKNRTERMSTLVQLLARVQRRANKYWHDRETDYVSPEDDHDHGAEVTS